MRTGLWQEFKRSLGFAGRRLQYDLGWPVFRRLATAVCCLAGALSAAGGADDLRDIRRVELDPQHCFRVRDLFLEREDLKLYFTDGYVIFAKPLRGRTFAALFLATRYSDIGEVLLIPPTPAERQSMARYLGETILNEKFRNAILFFTDGTAEALEAAIRKSHAHHLDAEEGERIAPRWSSVLRNLIDNSAPRILLDLFSNREPEQGFFAAAIRGSTLGRFDILIDPMLPEQIVAGRLVRSGGRSHHETWCRFPARSYRNGQKSVVPTSAWLEDYRIETRLGADLNMEVKLAATLVRLRPRDRAFGLELSSQLEVTAVRVAGADVEFLQYRPTATHGRSRGQAGVVVLLPGALAASTRHPIEIEYRGKIVSDKGSGVYFVADRQSWYPRSGQNKTHYELTFLYPSELELVATGSRFEDVTRDGERISRFRSGKPIRIAGFNLGDYVAARREVDGFRVEVRATKTVEQRLQPTRRPVVIPPLQVPVERRRGAVSEASILLLSDPPAANPAEEIERIADECAAAFAYFLRRFGEPSMPVTVISPVPGAFGEGFPGLVYASTLSYFERGDQMLQGLSTDRQRFYSDLLRPHEIAHQWFGNVVHVELDRDAWLMEALATYSSLLWLEERRGTGERNAALDEFRQNLLRRVGGESIESTGPIVWGQRLRSAKQPDPYQIIVYEKGAWILHMLRTILGDAEFFRMLRRLCDEHRSRPLTTEGFRALAAQFVPARHKDPGLRDFFDQWVYGTGIPRLAVRWQQTSNGDRHLLTVEIDQSGVPEYFPLRVPVEIQTLPGRSLVKSVVTGDSDAAARLSVVLRNPASRVVLDPESTLLAELP